MDHEQGTADLKFLKVFVLQRHSPVRLTLEDRIVYSYLTYASGIDKTPTKSDVTNWTGLHRSLVRRCFERLRKGELISEDGAVEEPPDDVFVPRKSGAIEPGGWQHKLAYVKTYWPAKGSGLRLRDTAVFSLLLSQPDRRYSKRYLGAVLSFGHKTLDGILRRLEHRKLCSFTPDRDGFTVTVSPISLHAPLFVQRDIAAPSSRPKTVATPEASYPQNSAAAYIYQRCRIHRMPVGLAQEIVELAASKRVGWDKFDALLASADTQNDKTEYSHCGLLLRHRLQELADPAAFRQKPDWPKNVDQLADKIIAKYGAEDALQKLSYYWNWTLKQHGRANAERWCGDDLFPALLDSPKSTLNEAMVVAQDNED